MEESFQLVAGHVALDLANTLDWRFDPERRVDLLPTYERFLEFVMQSGVISSTQVRRLLSRTSEQDSIRALRRALAVREAIDPLFRSIALHGPPPRESLKKLNHFIEKLCIPELVARRGSAFVLCPGDFSESPEGPLWPIVDGAVRLLTSADRAKIGECGEPTCRWLFLDSSKNHSRRWCSMKLCGNRAKVRRFRVRQDGEGGPI
jgi:predicted RNA-binding Zn ribbon-like protein